MKSNGNATVVITTAGIAVFSILGIAACGGNTTNPSKQEQQSSPQPSAPPTVERIDKTTFPNGTVVYHNYYSNGRTTTCTILPPPYDGAPQPQPMGDCVPDAGGI